MQDLWAWQFGPEQVAMIHQPVLSMLGLLSSPFARENRKVLHAWFPQAEDLDVPTTHLLQMEDPQSVAQGLAEFFSRHPMRQGGEEALVLKISDADLD